MIDSRERLASRFYFLAAGRSNRGGFVVPGKANTTRRGDKYDKPQIRKRIVAQEEPRKDSSNGM